MSYGVFYLHMHGVCCLATTPGVRRGATPEEGGSCKAPAFDELWRHLVARRQALQGSTRQQPLQVSDACYSHTVKVFLFFLPLFSLGALYLTQEWLGEA